MANTTKDLVLETIDDLVLDFISYDRKEDEDLPRGAIEELVEDGELTIDEMVERFREALEEHLEEGSPDDDDDDDDDDEDEEEEEEEDDED